MHGLNMFPWVSASVTELFDERGSAFIGIVMVSSHIIYHPR